MRQIINISLPKDLTRVVERAVKKGKYASTSEFFRDLLRRWTQQEEELYRQIQYSEHELRAGKGKRLRSLKDFRFSHEDREILKIGNKIMEKYRSDFRALANK